MTTLRVLVANRFFIFLFTLVYLLQGFNIAFSQDGMDELPIRVVAFRSGGPVPDRPGETFSFLQAPVISSTGTISFAGWSRLQSTNTTTPGIWSDRDGEISTAVLGGATVFLQNTLVTVDPNPGLFIPTFDRSHVINASGAIAE